MKKLKFLPILFLMACIGEDIIDDYVKPQIKITNAVTSLKEDTVYQFNYEYLNHIGKIDTPKAITWTSSDTSVLEVNEKGLAKSKKFGDVELSVKAILDTQQADTTISFKVTKKTILVEVKEAFGTLNSISDYQLRGDFTLKLENNTTVISFADNYFSDDTLPGLRVYLTNNPKSPDGGIDLGAVTIFKGKHEYKVPNVKPTDYKYLFYYCKPAKVAVGNGKIKVKTEN